MHLNSSILEFDTTYKVLNNLGSDIIQVLKLIIGWKYNVLLNHLNIPYCHDLNNNEFSIITGLLMIFGFLISELVYLVNYSSNHRKQLIYYKLKQSPKKSWSVWPRRGIGAVFH